MTQAISEDASDPLVTKVDAGNHEDNDNVLLFPIIQAGQFNIREEESTLSVLFRHLGRLSAFSPSQQPLVDLTSGYFGLYKPYQDLILANKADARIVAASPKVMYILFSDELFFFMLISI